MQNSCSVIIIYQFKRGYGATVARLTPDQTVGRSNRSGLTLFKRVK